MGSTKCIEFAISQCRDEYLSISATQNHKISKLEQYQANTQNDMNRHNLSIADELNAQNSKHQLEIKHIKQKHAKMIAKMIKKAKEETKEELTKEFGETIKNKARKMMGQMRDTQQQKIKSLQKKYNQLQSEMQQLKSDNNLISTKKEL